jgi:hypothetical protein
MPAFGRHSPSNALKAYGLHTPSDAIPAFGRRSTQSPPSSGSSSSGSSLQDCSARTSTRHSPSSASQAYGLQTPSDTIPAFGRHSPSNGDRLWLHKDRFRPAFPEQRIAGLRPGYPERRNPGLRPTSRHSPSNASQAYGMLSLSTPCIARATQSPPSSGSSASACSASCYKFGRTSHCRVEIQDRSTKPTAQHSPSNASQA